MATVAAVVAAAVVTIAGAASNYASRVESARSKLKATLLDTTTKSAVCLGTTFGKLKLSGGMNKWMKQEKCAQRKFSNALTKVCKRDEAEEAKANYNNTRHMMKHVILLANSEAEEESLATVSRDGDVEEGLGRRGPNMGRVTSENVACMVLIHKTEMHEGPVFSFA